MTPRLSAYFVLAISLVMLAQGQSEAPSRDTSERPNVLFIAIDDLNDWTGYLGGHPQARTPNLDRLAARGVAFTQAYCASPICIPSRTAVLTGIPPHISGITKNIGQFRKQLPEAQSLPQLFKANGYRTQSRGKVFHFPDPASWSHSSLNRESHHKDPKRVDLGQDIAGMAWGALDVEDLELADTQVTKWVCEQLSKRSEQPFFLACGLSKPHLPWSVPRRFFEFFPLDQIQLPVTQPKDVSDLPPLGRKRASSVFHGKITREDKWQAAVQAYLASVAFCDERLGEVLDALESGPNADDTLVILWSDHGIELGEKGHWKKSSLWENANRVPLIFAGPGIPRGVRNTHAVGLIDLYRTTTELCSLTAPESVAGHSLVPLLGNPEKERPAPVLTTLGREHSIRSDRWRLIRYEDGSEELYDHASDPHEWVNLAELPEHSEIRAELRAWMPQ